MAPKPPSSSPTTTTSDTLAEAIAASAGRIVANHLHSAATVPQGDLRDLLTAVRDLHRAMCSLSSSPHSTSKSLLHAQHLLQQAAASLQEEFRRILEVNRDTILDYDSTASSSLSGSASSLSDLDDVYTSPRTTVPTASLRSIAETMIAVGYTRECLAAYSSARRPVLEDNLRCLLGFDLPDPSHPHKPDRELASHRIGNWILAAPATVSLFASERVLCDSILPGAVADSCFAGVAGDLAVRFFAFPELAAAGGRRVPPEAVFHLLDMYNSIARLSPEIDAIFAAKSTSAVGSRARSTMLRLANLAGSAVAEFESAINHDRSKSAPPGAGLHPLTRWAMAYLSSLADRAGPIVEILAEEPIHPSSRSILADSPGGASESPRFATIHEDEEDVPIGVSSRMAWLLLLLLCKLDGKARLYKDAAASYLFLANNLDHIVSVVRRSGLEALVGHEWVARHERKVLAFARSFERLAWGPAMQAPAPADGEAFGLLEMAFEECWRKQVEMGLVVESAKLRDEIKESIAGKVLQPYRAAYVARGAVSGGLKLDEVRRRLEGLYLRSADTGEIAGSASGGSGHGVDSKEIGSGSGSGRNVVTWRSMLVKLTHRSGAR